MKKQNCFKSLFRIQNWIVYLRISFKITFIWAGVKEAIVFTLLVLWLIFVYIFCPRKDKASCHVFVFRRGYIQCHLWSSAILIEWRLKQIIDTWWYNPVQIFRNSSCDARFYSFRNWEPIYFAKISGTYMRGRDKFREGRMYLFCFVWILCFRFP